MTPQDRSLLIGGAAFILAMVGLYLGMAVVGTGEPTDTEASVDAAADASGDSERAIGVDAPADADVVSRLSGDGINGGIDPAGPSATSSTTSTSRPTTSESTTTTTNPTTSTAPTSAPEPAPTSTEPSAPDESTTVVSTPDPSDPATTPTPTSVPATEATTAPPTTAVASTQPAPTEPAPTQPAPTEPVPTAPPSSETPVGGLDAVEREIVRLTNELRADPAGRLARQKPMPSCVTDPFYGLSVDAATGHPGATPPLVLDERVSGEMSRPWALKMDGRNKLQHRPNGSQLEIYRSLDITVSATGENIAWFSGYPDEEAARVHFEGWRESDTGHYCAMVSGTYANIGVGHFKGATRSWAVQNFYSTR